MRYALLFLTLLPVFAERPPDPNRGIYAIWTNGKIPGLPFIKGGQVHVQWRTVEPAEGRYDFSDMDRQLEAVHKLGRVASVQLNGNEHPDFLFERVPYHKQKLSNQIRDTQGTLAYWHPYYVQSYTNLLAAYAKHLKESPFRSAVLGVRMNFNGLGTEHLDIPPAERDPSRWVFPAGVKPAPVWTKETAAEYRRIVMDAFVRNFTPELMVFVRNNIFAATQMSPEWIRQFETGKLGLFHTSSEMEPRQNGGGQYLAFIKYCRSGETTCYAESWADSWGNHGGIKDPRWCGPEQWNYWRMLVDLNCGVSFIAIYGADLANASNPEFRAAFDFAAKYAGYHASPSVSPGAWVALREGNTLQGDYTFLMNRLDDMKPERLVGPANQRFGAWARTLAGGSKVRFELDRDFARSLASKPAAIKVVYLDKSRGEFAVESGGRKFSAKTEGSGVWKTAGFQADSPSVITIGSAADLTLHMVEVTRQ
jgi:hypothetical protein